MFFTKVKIRQSKWFAMLECNKIFSHLVISNLTNDMSNLAACQTYYK